MQAIPMVLKINIDSSPGWLNILPVKNAITSKNIYQGICSMIVISFDISVQSLNLIIRLLLLLQACWSERSPFLVSKGLLLYSSPILNHHTRYFPVRR